MPDLLSDPTETTEPMDTASTSRALAVSTREDTDDLESDDSGDLTEEEVDPLSLSMTNNSMTKNLLQVSDIDGSLLNNTMDQFCQNLKNSVQEQFISSRERLFRQTENEINSITTIYQDSVAKKDAELSQLKGDHDALREKHNALLVAHSKIESSYVETTKKLANVRQLSQTVMKWKNDCEKKRFVANYVNHKIVPNKRRVRMQNIYYFWKNAALSRHHGRYDEIWQQRLETVSKKIITQYEININQLRDELQLRNHDLQQLHNDRNQQQQNLKRAFMRGVSALNLEAMSLFDPRKAMSTVVKKEEVDRDEE